jgi:hypothetical protein
MWTFQTLKRSYVCQKLFVYSIDVSGILSGRELKILLLLFAAAGHAKTLPAGGQKKNL